MTEFRYRTNWRGKLILQIKPNTTFRSVRGTPYLDAQWRDATVQDLTKFNIMKVQNANQTNN